MTIEFSKVNSKDEEDVLVNDAESEQFDDDDSANVYVSAIVPTTDDPSIPSLTFRVLVLGTLWNILLATINTVFGFRTNSFGVPSAVATLLSFPMGILMARVLPDKEWKLGPYKLSLNPGPFSIKEHVLIYIIASAGSGIAYGVDNVVMQRFEHYMGNKQVGYLSSLAFVMSLQLLGFGLAGMMRRFLVKPAAMFWPGTLSSIAMFVGFHEKVDETKPFSKYRMSRFKFFWLAAGGFFVYSWLPGYFMSVLRGFSLLCLINSNETLRFLSSFSFGNGNGLMALTLDWSYIGSGVLTMPFYVMLQSALSSIIFGWIVTPLLFFNNSFEMDTKIGGGWTLNSNLLYDKNGSRIQPLSLMDQNTYDLNFTAYQEIAPIRLSTAFAVTYGTSFLSIASIISYVALWYGKSIVKQFKAAMKQQDEESDIHNRLMAAYPDIPDWMYLAFLGGMVVVHCIVSVATPFVMPLWSVFLCLAIVLICLLPIGIITAVTGIEMFINVLSEFVIGYLIPGQTVSIICFKSLGTNTLVQAIDLISDLKLGHYMKINPIHMVFAQFYGTIIGAIINTVVAIASEDLMSAVLFKNDDWMARDYDTFYSAAAIWGAIGPARFFGPDSPYYSLLWWFLYGLLLPIIPWVGKKIYKADFWEYLNIPILCRGFGSPGSHKVGVVMPLFVSWLFQSHIFRTNREWWNKYNYILASASGTGVAIAVFVIAILEQNDITAGHWWGNPKSSLDYYCFD